MKAAAKVWLCGLTLLSGCAMRPSPAEFSHAYFGDFPLEYREISSGWVKGQLKDPYSAQIEVTSGPVMGWNGLGGAEYGWIVCSRVNAKNSYGAYTGYLPAYTLIRDGRVVRGFLATNSDSVVAGALCK